MVNSSFARPACSEQHLAWRVGNASRISNVINVQSFVAYAVGTMLTSNWDGTSNNHHLYQDPVTGMGRE